MKRTWLCLFGLHQHYKTVTTTTPSCPKRDCEVHKPKSLSMKECLDCGKKWRSEPEYAW
jgi:hypothetical protein